MPWSADPLKALGEALYREGDTAAAQATFRKAIAVDGGDWQAWLDLAATVVGPQRAIAVARAKRLYPTSPEVVEFEEAVQAHRSD
jgi:Flp pilus assembly protein TadD